MHKFEFRLEKVLHYRELLEQWAKDAYLEARASKLEAEAMFGVYASKREELCKKVYLSLEDRKAHERLMQKLDVDESQQQIIVNLLSDEEEKKRIEWIDKRRDYEAMVKLRDEALSAWNEEAAREEQKSLDEWSNMRRAA